MYAKTYTIYNRLIDKKHNATFFNCFIDTLLTICNSIQDLTWRDYNLLLNHLVISRDSQILQDYIELNNYGELFSRIFIKFWWIVNATRKKTTSADSYMFRNVIINIQNNGYIYIL